jgi:hypothetical protein
MITDLPRSSARTAVTDVRHDEYVFSRTGLIVTTCHSTCSSRP